MKLLIEVSLFVSALTLVSAEAASLGFESPLVVDATGNWKEYVSSIEKDLGVDSHSDVSCRKHTGANLRELFFEQFRYYTMQSPHRVGNEEVARFAKVLGMTPYESSGASAAITDMKFHGSAETFRLLRADNVVKVPGKPGTRSSIPSLEKLMKLKTIKFDQQTNFGLLQMSADRLMMKSTRELARKMITDLKSLYATHPEEMIERCGTKLMFKDSDEEIRAAFDGIQACDVGYTTEEKVKCFGRWAALCPSYNITLALVTTPKYFATRDKAPLCTEVFERIRIK